MTTIEALIQCSEDLTINQPTIYYYCQKLCTECASVLKDVPLTFDLEFAIIHWNEKLLPATTENKKIETLSNYVC